VVMKARFSLRRKKTKPIRLNSIKVWTKSIHLLTYRSKSRGIENLQTREEEESEEVFLTQSSTGLVFEVEEGEEIIMIHRSIGLVFEVEETEEAAEAEEPE
jgi:hypothetical protein